MKSLFRGRNRLLFRSYLFLVGSLLAVAIVLDFGFRQLQSQDEIETDRWLRSTAQLVEAELRRTNPSSREAVAADLARTIGMGVQVLARDDVQLALSDDQLLTPLVDTDGNTSYLHDAASIQAIIRLGPIAAAKESLALQLLPPIFYLSIFVVVGLWLRPILRDIDTISAGAQRFAADYRESLSTEHQTSELQPLARNLDEMAARLSGVLRSQKELIAALSHEMRTPLARLRFAIAVLNDKADDVLKEKLDAMNDDVEEIDNLVASMLNYARLDHPDIEMRWQDVPVEAWLEQIVAKVPFGSAEIQIDISSAPDTARFDSTLMELALSNLLVNAAKYAEHKIRCSFTTSENSNELCIEDDGAGIPEAEREKVFKAFTRVDDSRNRETGGYGLGLAIVARVAELHGGEVVVDRSPQLNGARFFIRWPSDQRG